MTPSAVLLLVERARRRVMVAAAARAVAVASCAAAVIALLAWMLQAHAAFAIGAGVVAIVVALAYAVRGVRTGNTLIARMIESRAPCDNLLVTATELDTATDAEARESDLRRRIREAAQHAAASIDARTLFPLGRPVTVAAVAIAAWIVCAAFALTAPRPATVARSLSARSDPAAIREAAVTITPPRYVHRAATTTRNPDEIAAIEGSRIALRIATRADSVIIESAHGALPASRTDDGFIETAFTTTESGFVTIATRSADGRAGDRRMIRVVAVPDAPPSVRITRPARDLHLSDSTATFDVDIEASDDIRMQSLTLRYTRVSGAGEQFTFSEGVLPVSLTRTDSTHWLARATIRLKEFTLAKGDMIVYRAAAQDGRPDVAPTLSDAFIAEIIAPGSTPMAGFAADDETDRYALSQEMIIQKTRALIRAASAIPADSLRETAMFLAAEQRAVRAEFVFMMGGEVAEEVIDAADQAELHEEAEAAGESDIAAGRGANRSRIALVDAIRNMSQASTSLVEVDLASALQAELRALTSLQGAFSHSRYILRGLTQHEQLDMTRRLSGELAEAAALRRATPDAPESPVARALRPLLDRANTLASRAEPRSADADEATAIAASLARIAPGDSTYLATSRILNGAADDIAHARTVDARAALQRAASNIGALLRRYAPPAASKPAGNRLDGAMNDALGRSGGSIR